MAGRYYNVVIFMGWSTGLRDLGDRRTRESIILTFKRLKI